MYGNYRIEGQKIIEVDKEVDENLETTFEYLLDNTKFSERELMDLHERKFLKLLRRTIAKQAAKIEALKAQATRTTKK